MKKNLYRLHADICKMFANPTRLEIVDLLRHRALTVSDLVKAVHVSQANISQHLAIMKSKGIVKVHRKGKNMYYTLAHADIIKAFDILQDILRKQLKDSKKLSKQLGEG